MAITAIYSAATGLKALSTRIDVIANNLANAETNGFKAQRANFEDLYYQQMKQPGTTDSSNVVSPSGIFVGLGTKLSNTQLDLTQGAMQNTSSPLDLGIQGSGFFPVKILPIHSEERDRIYPRRKFHRQQCRQPGREHR